MRAEERCQAGIDAFKAKDIETAVRELEQAATEDSGSLRAFTYLGAAYAEQARYNASIGALKRAAELKPDVAKIHYNLGQAYEAAGVPNEAFFAYKKALDVDPFYWAARTALLNVSARLKTMRARQLEVDNPEAA